MSSVETHKLFPSEEATKFGDWVKAGALKVGDQISVRAGIDEVPSVAGQGLATSQTASPRKDGKADALAENKDLLRNGAQHREPIGERELVSRTRVAQATADSVSANSYVTIKSITSDNTPHRVYNLEVESHDGQITHNYFVGEDEVWVHNGRGSAWQAICNSTKTSKYIRGWCKQEKNSGRSYSRFRTPPGCDLGHHPSNRGSHGPNSRPETPRDNRRRPSLTGNNPKWR